MLFIYTSENYFDPNKHLVSDIEAQFTIKKQDILNKYEQNEFALSALKEIEGMTFHQGDFINAKFGAVSLDNISTGGKGCLLLSLYNNEIILKTDELGYNCIEYLCHLAKTIDIHVYSSCEYNYLCDDIEAYVNNTLYTGTQNILDAMEAAYE